MRSDLYAAIVAGLVPPLPLADLVAAFSYPRNTSIVLVNDARTILTSRDAEKSVVSKKSNSSQYEIPVKKFPVNDKQNRWKIKQALEPWWKSAGDQNGPRCAWKSFRVLIASYLEFAAGRYAVVGFVVRWKTLDI